MILEALRYFTQQAIKPEDRVVEVMDEDNKNRQFIVDDSGRGVEIQPQNYRAKKAFELNTLTGLVDYIKSNLDRKDNKLFVQVFSEEEVGVHGLIESDGGREILAVANPIVPEFYFDRYLGVEELIIAMQSTFQKTVDRDNILKVIGNVKEESIRQTGDDGHSQAVTIRSGIAGVEDKKVPNQVHLQPYRTFLEVEQPASDFIFRMQGGPTAALFEADGGGWRNEAIQNIKDYLDEELKEEIESGRITVIA